MPESVLPFNQNITYALQIVLSVFSATVLVPILVGLPPSVALLSAGVGTIIFLIATKFKVPQFLGSSFAFLPALFATADNLPARTGAIIVVGLVYLVVALIVSRAGTQWLDRVFPPVVIGSVIITIGLGLAPTAVQGALFDGSGSYHIEYLVIALVTIMTIALVGTIARGFVRSIPIIIGLVAGYVFTLIAGSIAPGSAYDLIDLANVKSAPWFAVPTIHTLISGVSFEWAVIITFVVVSIATLVEHIGDMYTLSSIVGRDFVKDPGLSRSLIGDGLATSVAGLLGSVPNTSYGECSATQAISRVHSVRVILTAAIIVILLSFVGKFSALVQTIPAPVLQGACFVLFGIIASSGLRNIVKAGVDYDDTRNLIISSVILVSGIGGAVLEFSIPGGTFSLKGMAFGTVLGVILNLVLPRNRKPRTQ
jgi:uracil permease